jgi:hypothetical protein
MLKQPINSKSRSLSLNPEVNNSTQDDVMMMLSLPPPTNLLLLYIEKKFTSVSVWAVFFICVTPLPPYTMFCIFAR